ncbi:MAG: orotidine-5'-phosphate decarboxylase [Pseudonocardia sp.]|nr:orotidine-5'-phosphate decarboxylase [Pseudonocardia sp.]
MRGFGGRVVDVVDGFGPLCVGIDPHPGLLASWGVADDISGLARFCDVCVEAFAGHVGIVKPQSAFFERHGSGGIAVLERLLVAFADSGTLTILDAKRGDIGSTMDGYADAYLAPGAPLGADAVTLSPYLGFAARRLVPEVSRRHTTWRPIICGGDTRLRGAGSS